MRKKTTDIGAALNLAFHAIEDANLRLKGVFQDVDFNNKERFPDTVLEACSSTSTSTGCARRTSRRTCSAPPTST